MLHERQRAHDRDGRLEGKLESFLYKNSRTTISSFVRFFCASCNIIILCSTWEAEKKRNNDTASIKNRVTHFKIGLNNAMDYGGEYLNISLFSSFASRSSFFASATDRIQPHNCDVEYMCNYGDSLLKAVISAIILSSLSGEGEKDLWAQSRCETENRFLFNDKNFFTRLFVMFILARKVRLLKNAIIQNILITFTCNIQCIYQLCWEHFRLYDCVIGLWGNWIGKKLYFDGRRINLNNISCSKCCRT